METDPEHQEHDTDLGKLIGNVNVGHESGRIGTDENACGKVSDEGGQVSLYRKKSADEREPQTGRDRANEGEIMLLARFPTAESGP